MKKIIVVLFALVTIGSVSGQQLGIPTPLQRILNELPAIPIAGRNLKFQFGGTTWIATVNGENALAGTVETVDISGGSILTLKQTHVWAAAAGRAVGGLLGGGALGGAVGSLASTWVATPGPEIVLDYNSVGPRATLSMASEARIAEARTARVYTAETPSAGVLSAAAETNIPALSPTTVAVPPPLISVAVTGYADPNIFGYFVVVNGMQTGPYDQSGLRALISQKQLTKNSLVWKEGMSSWIVAGAVEELAPLFSATSARSKPASNIQQNVFSFSIGGGAYIAKFFSGGIEAKTSYVTVSFSIPYFGGGAHIFFDATYLETSLGIFFGGAEFEAITDSSFQTEKLGDFEFTILNIGVLGKYPFTINPKVGLFPLLGLDYAIVLSSKYNGKEENESTDWNHFIFKFGGGLDYSINDSLYFRFEALYGVRFPSNEEKDLAKYLADDSTITNTLLGHGFTAKLALGYKF